MIIPARRSPNAAHMHATLDAHIEKQHVTQDYGQGRQATDIVPRTWFKGGEKAWCLCNNG
jgi:hypothetical protein